MGGDRLSAARLGADIGGTFTDLALEVDGAIYSAKVLTNYAAPEQAILDGTKVVCERAGIDPSAIGIVIHGTTLATNALIERRGAKTALVTTEGFRDVIEMRTESRFDQYDLNIVLPTPLIPRQDRLTIGGRIGADGTELRPLDEAALDGLAETIAARGYRSVAIGLIHSYANPAHERRVREVLEAKLPGVSFSISSEVSPQMREYERFNTVCANAYVRPMMADYLARLESRIGELGIEAPLYLIHSGGGLINVETAMAFPVRLVESGPAGGAIFAADLARRLGLDRVLSFDMGGTTAKICLVDDATPRTARTFEVARTARFAKGSGMPISIPVIEMIEIGAGGGSLAAVDAMSRITVGPESAGSEPGPACYGRGGTRPAITDADVILGRIDPGNFAGGAMTLDAEASRSAVSEHVGSRLGLDAEAAAFGIAEVVDENMANAARVHAVESGKDISGYTMVAFGGAAPLHAQRLCTKLGVDRLVVPPGAGVGSAIGFLRAPFAYEAVRSQLVRLHEWDDAEVAGILSDLTEQASSFVGEQATRVERTAFMRYAGQGWEIPVILPEGAVDRDRLNEDFRAAYTRFFGRPIEGGVTVEVVTWSVNVAADADAAPPVGTRGATGDVAKPATRQVFDAGEGAFIETGIVEREALSPGDGVAGPAIVVERETATVIAPGWRAVMQDEGSLLIERVAS